MNMIKELHVKKSRSGWSVLATMEDYSYIWYNAETGHVSAILGYVEEGTYQAGLTDRQLEIVGGIIETMESAAEKIDGTITEDDLYETQYAASYRSSGP